VRDRRRTAAPPQSAVPRRTDHRPGHHRQARIREFLREYNKRTGATILLTSHYMADVTALCERIIIIHHGQLKYDGGITNLSRRIAPFKLIGVMLAEANGHDLSSMARRSKTRKTRRSAISRSRPKMSPGSHRACWPIFPSTTSHHRPAHRGCDRAGV
jgi:ABC-type glutathione transport system ATPase component